MQHYSFTTEFSLDAPVALVWKTLMDFRGWKKWWKFVRRIQLQSLDGKEHVTMSIGLLFYQLQFTLVVTPVVFEKHAMFTSSGDLLGNGQFLFSTTSTASQVHFDWNVATTKRWMNVIGPVLRPLFIGFHAIVMHQFVNGFANELDAAVFSQKNSSNLVPQKSSAIY